MVQAAQLVNSPRSRPSCVNLQAIDAHEVVIVPIGGASIGVAAAMSAF